MNEKILCLFNSAIFLLLVKFHQAWATSWKLMTSSGVNLWVKLRLSSKILNLVSQVELDTLGFRQNPILFFGSMTIRHLWSVKWEFSALKLIFPLKSHCTLESINWLVFGPMCNWNSRWSSQVSDFCDTCLALSFNAWQCFMTCDLLSWYCVSLKLIKSCKSDSKMVIYKYINEMNDTSLMLHLADYKVTYNFHFSIKLARQWK